MYKNLMNKRTFVAAVLMMVSVLTTGCGDANIDAVKEGSLGYMPNVTMDGLFNHALSDCTWKTEVSELGEEMVTVEGELKLENFREALVKVPPISEILTSVDGEKTTRVDTVLYRELLDSNYKTKQIKKFLKESKIILADYKATSSVSLKVTFALNKIDGTFEPQACFVNFINGKLKGASFGFPAYVLFKSFAQQNPAFDYLEFRRSLNSNPYKLTVEFEGMTYERPMNRILGNIDTHL